ncbi:DUF4383 domain-containing protein [Rhodococcus sp. T7]|uniref:DUF4383 domain-containing protein n=1 Tax=Rhodococcus sp. T7 TaxID=627444 RepID=UPI001F3B02F5|nr:DUF4383 domain-containing protein [Rhodococcus sp. T7]
MREHTAVRRMWVQNVVLGIGAVFLGVGALAFLPEITSDYDRLSFADSSTGTKLFGLLEVSILRNVEHLLFGIGGLISARTARAARVFLVVGGAAYLMLWAGEQLIDLPGSSSARPPGTADTWIHLGVGVGLIVCGLVAIVLDHRRTPHR